MKTVVFPPSFMATGRACILGALLASLAACSKQAPNAARPPQSVSAATATAKDVPIYIDALGQTTAFESVNVVSQVEGKIVELTFVQGSMVKKGDKIATIFQAPYQAAVDRAAGQVAVDQANLKLAQLQFDRSKELLAQKYISQQQYDTYAAQVDAITGQLQIDQASLANANINLEYTKITAPIDGMIGNFKQNVGNVVKVDDIPITTIQEMNPMYADFVVSVADFPNLRRHFDQSGGKLKVHVSSLSEAGKDTEGDLNVLGNSIAPPTGTVQLRATIANDSLIFWPNQPIRVRIFLETIKDAVTVPQTAVGLNQQGEYVFVIHPAKDAKQPPTVEMRPITVGETQDDGTTVISSGLKAGEEVVVQGQLYLAPNAAVNVVELDGKSLAPPPAATPANKS